MAKTIANYSLGPAGTPQEVKQLRKASYDLHNEIGSAIVFKHRWTQADVDAGLTYPCPNHDELYHGRDTEWDQICFGTGYVGGYADGQILFVTIQDTQETQIKIGPTGILTMDMHPAMTTPWLPRIADGDMVITGDFEQNSWTLSEEDERYILRDVSPITMRGPGWGRQSGGTLNRQRISQESNLDRLPIGHPLYNVPIIFDYSQVPPDVTPPYSPGAAQYTEIILKGNINGIENPNPQPATQSIETHVIITGKIGGRVVDPGTVVNF